MTTTSTDRYYAALANAHHYLTRAESMHAQAAVARAEGRLPAAFLLHAQAHAAVEIAQASLRWAAQVAAESTPITHHP